MARRIAAVAFGVTLGLAAAGAARANLVTFDGGVLSGPDAVTGRVGAYVEDGLEFDFYGEAPDFLDDGQGGHQLRIHQNSFIEIYLADGGRFSFDSFDFSGGGDTALFGNHNGYEDVGVRLTGLGTTVQLTAMDAGWGDLGSAVWCGNCVSGFDADNNMDNVRFDVLQSQPPGVPEPVGWTLLIAGFFGLGAALRRRSSEAAPSARG